MYCSFVGDTALAMGEYDLARAHHQRALALYREMAVYWMEAASGQHYGWAYSLDRLGDIAMAQGSVEQARESYRQALEVARDHPHVPLHLDVLVSQATLRAGEGRGEGAVELAALALHHPASHVEVTRRAQRLLDQLEAELPPDVFAQALEHGRARELEATVEELLDLLNDSAAVS
jgi:tetratricopeptide (TPR) repeat protein